MIPHICTFSEPEDYRISDGQRVWFFDWSERFGPSLTNGKGEILANASPPERSPFWRCFGLWFHQGKRWEASSAKGIRIALWDEPPAARYVVDQRGVVISADEPDGFHDLYSLCEFVDEDGNAYRARKPRRGSGITA